MDGKASEARERAWKSPYVSPFSRGVIFTRVRVSLVHDPWRKMATTRSVLLTVSYLSEV